MDWREVFSFRFRPSVDVLAVVLGWGLVTGALSLATFVITADNGVGYFLAYAIGAALVAGIVLPTVWTVWVRRRTIADLGVSAKNLWVVLGLQLVFAIVQYFLTFAGEPLPALMEFLPLAALALCIGFFEAVFWRGFVFQRLEESFGLIPGLVLAAALYAVYHIGYGMPWSEISFLFIIGVVYTVIFRLTRSVFVLWPVLQPMGQLVTLVKDGGLPLPPIAILGFLEVLFAMALFLFFAHRYAKKRAAKAVMATAAPA